MSSEEMARANPDSPAGRAWRTTVAVTLVAIGLFAVMRWLPLSGGALHYTDFQTEGRGPLEFCQPGSPQFAPVDAVRSPVELTLEPLGPLAPGVEVAAVARLKTSAGKPIVADDLLVVHTRRLHLLVVSVDLEDYQHVHPESRDADGTWSFRFTPRRTGRYRVFADFTPRATGRALYAGAELSVAGPPARPVIRHGERLVDQQGLRFRLGTDGRDIRCNETTELTLAVTRQDGGPVVLEPVMDALAHLVAFDAACSGFAHLHPVDGGTTQPGPGPLTFLVHLTEPGAYRLWAQVLVEGRERFVPFDLSVVP